VTWNRERRIPVDSFSGSGHRTFMRARMAAARCLGSSRWLAARVGLALLLAPAAALGEGAWVLTEIARHGALTTVSTHPTLAACLDEQKSREAAQLAYLRAANESSPRDHLPLPALTVSFRCVQQ
jgi:hypothetical protein